MVPAFVEVVATRKGKIVHLARPYSLEYVLCQTIDSQGEPIRWRRRPASNDGRLCKNCEKLESRLTSAL